MIDTHTHIYMSAYEADGGSVAAVRRALAAGVRHMILPNVDMESIAPLEALAQAMPSAVSHAMGLHPTELHDSWRSDLDSILGRLSGEHGYVAVGECGIDLYWERDTIDRQMEAFDIQAAKALELDLPLIIHCRDGLPQALEVLEGHRGVKGVFHSFGGSLEDVDAIRRCGDFYFGINGIVTFKNSGVSAVLPAIGLERLLLETDSPYLAPVPRRGKRNESAYLPYIGAKVAEAVGVDLETVDRVTTDNAVSLFKLKNL